MGKSHDTFSFDTVYDTTSKQTDLYVGTMRPLVDATLQGFSGMVFAYCQMSTGKNDTKQGTWVEPELCRVIPNASEHIFTHTLYS